MPHNLGFLVRYVSPAASRVFLGAAPTSRQVLDALQAETSASIAGREDDISLVDCVCFLQHESPVNLWSKLLARCSTSATSS